MQPTEPSLWQAAPSDINNLFTQRVYRQTLLERPAGRFWMRLARKHTAFKVTLQRRSSKKSEMKADFVFNMSGSWENIY